MKPRLIQIGNLQGIRMPKVLLEQSGLGEEVELQAKKAQIIIRSTQKPRHGWGEKFKAMAENGDDRLVDGKAVSNKTSWDEKEWTW